MEDFGNLKKSIEKDIVEQVIMGLEKGFLKEEELPLIGQFVLEKIDLLKNQQELIAFLGELSSKWPIFENIKKIEEGRVREKEEDEVAEGVLTLLKHGKIENALNLAKNITSK